MIRNCLWSAPPSPKFRTELCQFNTRSISQAAVTLFKPGLAGDRFGQHTRLTENSI